MRKYFLTAILIGAIILSSKAQVSPAYRIDTTKASVAYWEKWMTDLNDMGVESRKDSFFVKPEVMKLLKDADYRQTVYPATYNWPQVVQLLNKMELKKAFWQMINLYQTDTVNRRVIIGTFVMYDSLLEMDKILLNTFYTYGLTDPEVCRVRNNKPDIYRPDILEQKLRVTREIVNYIWLNRKRKSEAKS